MHSHPLSLLLDTRTELAALRGPDAVSFAQSIGLHNPALIDGYDRLMEREIARLERLADKQSN